MDELTQQRFRPLIEKRLAAIEQQLPYSPSDAGAGVSTAPATAMDLRGESARLSHALRRIDGGFYGRCIRCGRDLPVKRLERELDALTCDPCPTRSAQPPRPGWRRGSLV